MESDLLIALIVASALLGAAFLIFALRPSARRQRHMSAGTPRSTQPAGCADQPPRMDEREGECPGAPRAQPAKRPLRPGAGNLKRFN